MPVVENPTIGGKYEDLMKKMTCPTVNPFLRLMMIARISVPSVHPPLRMMSPGAGAQHGAADDDRLERIS